MHMRSMVDGRLLIALESDEWMDGQMDGRPEGRPPMNYRLERGALGPPKTMCNIPTHSASVLSHSILKISFNCSGELNWQV